MDRLGLEETTEADAYGAQLARKHAAKIEGAQKLVDKASKDPKVIKQLKATGRGKGKGKGKGKGRGRGKPEMPDPEPVSPVPPVPPVPEQPEHQSADEEPGAGEDGPLKILWNKMDPWQKQKPT